MSPFGLDIGNSSIKAVHLEKNGEQFTLLSAGITLSPVKSISSALEKDLILVAESIRKLISDAKIIAREVNISLPESQVFTRMIQLPLLTDEEIAAAISWQAEPYIPIPVEQASIDYQIIERREPTGHDPGGVDVLLVAVPKELVEKYMKVVKLSGLTIANIESDLLALSRSVAPIGQSTVLVDVGSSSTNIGIVKNGQLMVSRSVATGGEVLTRAVSSALSVTSAQAEEYKKTYGLNPKALEGKVKQAIEPVFRVITDEIKKTLQFYKTDVRKDDQVGIITISGGTAGMAEAASYLTETLGLEVVVGDPFSKVIKNPETQKKLESWAPLYSIATGLAQNI